MSRRFWTMEEDALLRQLYADTPTTQLAARLQRSLSSVYVRAHAMGFSKSAAYLASPHACRLRRGDHVGAAFRFKPGQAPANKGLRRPGWSAGRMRETQFKRGQRSGKAARQYMPIGSTRLIEGYVYRKVSDVPNVPYTVNWKPEHVLVWQRAHGPVPPGHVIAFRNGDPADIQLDNLACLSRRELMARNSVHNLPAPLPQTIQLLGALRRQIRRKSHGQEQDRRSA